MESNPPTSMPNRTPHSWLRKIRLAYVPGPAAPLLESFVHRLLACFREHGHSLLATPQPGVDVILTTAVYGEPLNWRKALLFTARRRYQLTHPPVVFTLIHMTPEQFQDLLDHFSAALAKPSPDPADFAFPGLTPRAYYTLYEQGRRGGPILSLIRLLQSQALSIRILLVVGDQRPHFTYTFDLVGAHPRSAGEGIYEDLMYRIVTAASTQEITAHEVVGEPIPRSLWQSLSTPPAMRVAGRQFGERHFFTEMVRVANLVYAPAIHDVVSSQYSEGCFATWEPALDALMVTVTGSARPVDKQRLSDDELAVIVGVRPDGLGARIRTVEGKRNDPPSSEAVELMEMDSALPRIDFTTDSGTVQRVPVARSKLHGHRAVHAYDPQRVEHVYLDAPYYHYPVSCSTEAQARAIKSAFARSQALQNPADPRQVVFTILPGHGVLIVEKWVPHKAPFQVIWEAMDAGWLTIENSIPQGWLTFSPNGDGRHILTAP